MSRTKVIVICVLIGIVILAIAVQLVTSAAYRKASRNELALLVAEGGSRNVLDLVPKPLGNLGDKPLTLLYADDFRVPMRDMTSLYTTAPRNDPKVAEADNALKAFGEFSDWTPPSKVAWDAKAAETKPFNEDWLPQLEMLISGSGPLLEHVRTTASNGNAMFDIDWTQGANTLLPHVSRVRDDGRLLRADAYLRLRKGDTAGAIADVHTMLHLRDTLDHDPVIISKRVAMAVDRIALSTLAMVVEEGHADRESVEAILKELEGREARNRMTGVLLGETTMDLDTLDMAAKDPEMYRLLTGANVIQVTTTEDKIVRAVRNLAFRATWMREADEYNLLREMRVVREWSRKPLAESLKMPPYASRAGDSRAAARRFTDLAIPPLDGIFDWEAEADLDIAKTRLLLAVYLYKLDNGSYPESVEALVGRYLSQVPVDPFDNRPLVYTWTGDGYTIESAREKELLKAGDVQR
jgi:hypothetical protein